MAETRRKTMLEKIWNVHVISEIDDSALLFVDRHILQETACSQAFDGLRREGRKVRHPELTFGVTDHIVSTRQGRTRDSFPEGKEYLTLMAQNCAEHGIRLFDLSDPRQGIEHVVAPELGLTLPGCSIVCADSHTATVGAFGAMAWGFGTSEVEHVLATQAVMLAKPKAMQLDISGRLARGVYAKDAILHVIGTFGTTIGRGYFIEYTGEVVRTMSMEERMTICNMSIELSSRAGMIAPDDTTFHYLEGREYSPRGALWEKAVAAWRQLPTDSDATFDKELVLDCSDLAPQVTWGVTPAQVTSVDGRVPDPGSFATAEDRDKAQQALQYMALKPGDALSDIAVDYAFLGSCTNGRLSDFKAAADVLKGRKVASGVRALAVPGSSTVRREAEALGIDRIFKDAGFEWRESGCSMCLAINDDQVPSGKRCISSSNRNFESRQGPNSRTHLASPAMVAAAAVAGTITDVRRYL